MNCFKCLLIAMLWCLAIPVTAEDSSTAPQTIVDVTIEPAGNGRGMVMTGAKLFFATTQASYYDELQRDRPDLANRTQEIALLQSKLIRFGVNQIFFRSVGGKELSIDEVKTRLKKNPLALMLPVGASIHPQLAAALSPDTIVVSRVNRRPSPQRLIPRPNAE